MRTFLFSNFLSKKKIEMLRRLSNVASGVLYARSLKPSEELKKIYDSDLDGQKYPVDVVASDSSIFAKFLYKVMEPKSSFDIVLADFKKIDDAVAKLPVFWERSSDVENTKEFQTLSPPMIFTLCWMQSNGMLEQLPKVRAVYETFVNAQRKKAVARIYVKEAQDAAAIEEGKKVATELHKGIKEISGFALDFAVVVDRDITTGFAVELNGLFSNNAKGKESAQSSTSEVDYTTVPAVKYAATKWPETVETEVLRKYIDQLTLFDAEEAKYGV